MKFYDAGSGVHTFHYGLLAMFLHMRKSKGLLRSGGVSSAQARYTLSYIQGSLRRSVLEVLFNVDFKNRKEENQERKERK